MTRRPGTHTLPEYIMKRIIALCLAICAGIAFLYIRQGNAPSASPGPDKPAQATAAEAPAPPSSGPVPTPPMNIMRGSAASSGVLPFRLDQSPKAEPILSVSPACSDPYPETSDYVLNDKSHKFHVPTCRDVKKMNPSNRKEYSGTVDQVIAMGYKPCGHCHPQ